MSGRYNDKAYMAICSEKTLQSNEKGFFLTFAEHVAENAGEKWIKHVFGSMKSDWERIRCVYQNDATKDVVIEVLSHVQEIYRQKSSDISQARRLDAEKAFKNGETRKALMLYSQSVLRAQPTGENNLVDSGISLAIALWGRSQVLMALKEYSLALADIQVAMKENLPSLYRAEAFWRMGICYKARKEEDKARVSFGLAEKLLNDEKKLSLLKNDINATFQEVSKKCRKSLPSVTGKRHKEYQYATKRLAVKEAAGKGRYVVANDKIHTGDTIVVEPPYAACLVPDCFGSHCHHCFERLISPVGCNTCSNVAFCKPECREQALSTYHKYECKFLDLMIGSGMSILAHTALRMITQNTMEKTLEIYGNKSNIPVYSLCTLADMRDPADFLQRTLMAAFLLRCLQKSGYFGESRKDSVEPTEEEYRVGEMILFHLQMLQFNAHEIYETRHSSEHRFRGAKAAYIGVAVYPTVALFNHDCYPAVTRWFVGKNIIINAVRPLNPGDVIAENYGPVFTRKPLAERQRSLSSRYWFNCGCLACTQNWPSLDDGLDSVSRRIRCANHKCSYLFTLPVQNETSRCPRCKNKVSLTDNIIQMKTCEEQYQLAIQALEDQEPKRAISLLCQAIDTFHSVSQPPHRDTHLGQEILRACLADSGNVYECLIKS